MGLDTDLHTLAGLTAEPITASEAAAALDEDARAVLEAGARLVESGDLREEGAGWVAVTTAASGGPTRANLADRLATVVGDGRPGTKGRLLVTAGRPTDAIPLLVEAAGSGDAEAAALALEVGPPSDPVQAGRLHLALAGHHQGRGESATALDHARRAIPLLDSTTAIDALGFTAEIHDNLQQPQESATWATMAAGAACARSEPAKEGSLLTLASRGLSRLGFADESEAAARKGQALVEANGTPTQRARARNNAAWVMLDHGDAAGAAAAFGSIADLAGYVGGDLAEAARLASRSRALFHACRSDEAMADHAAAIAKAGDAAAPQFLAYLAFAEGATLHGVGDAAVDAADRVVSIVEGEMPAWRNVGHLTAARAYRIAGNAEAAAEHLAQALEATPDGIDGIRIRLRCEVERLQQLPDGVRWPKDDAAKITDALLQARWYAPAAELMGLRAKHEKGTDWGAQAVALAARLGSPLLAARAAQEAGAWDKPEGALAAELVRDADPYVAEAWRDAWDADAAVMAATAVTTEADADAVDAQLEGALARAGLVGAATSPAQRAAEGLQFQGRRTARGWLAPILSWAAALVTIAVVAALLFWPDYRIIDPPERVSGSQVARGGPTNQGIAGGVGIAEPEGLYWEPVTDLGGNGMAAPIAGSVGVAVADMTSGNLYGFDQKSGRRIWTHTAAGPLAFRPTIINGADGGGSPLPHVVWATTTGVVAARPLLGSNTPETWSEDVGGAIIAAPIAGPPTGPTTGFLYVAVRRPTGPVIVVLDSSGGVASEVPLAAEPVGELAATDTALLFTDADGRLIQLDTRTANLDPICDPPAPAVPGQAPIVAGDLVFVPFPGGAVGVFSPCRQGFDWGHGILVQAQIDMDLTHRPAFVDETFVYIGNGALNRYDPTIWDVDRHVIDPEDLATKEQREQAAEIQSELFPWDAPFLPDEDDQFSTDPVIAGDLVLVGTQAGVVFGIDLETGVERWRYELEGSVVDEIVAVDGALFVTTNRGMLFAIGGPAGAEGNSAVEPLPFPEGRPAEPVDDTTEDTTPTDGTTTTTVPEDDASGSDAADDDAEQDVDSSGRY